MCNNPELLQVDSAKIAPIEPDWKRAFYSLALRVVEADALFRTGSRSLGEVIVSEAVQIVHRVEATPTFQTVK